MGVALLTKHIVCYCQEEEANAVLAIHVTVKGVLPAVYTVDGVLQF